MSNVFRNSPNPKKGFTLLEILIVVIIVSVLASLALPKFFSMVERTRSVEAINTISMIRKELESCIHSGGNPLNCSSPAMQTKFQSYFNSPNSHFEFNGVNIGYLGPDLVYLIRVGRNSHELGTADPGGSWTCGSSNSSAIMSEVIFCQNPTATKIVGSGFYSNL